MGSGGSSGQLDLVHSVDLSPWISLVGVLASSRVIPAIWKHIYTQFDRGFIPLSQLIFHHAGLLCCCKLQQHTISYYLYAQIPQDTTD